MKYTAEVVEVKENRQGTYMKIFVPAYIATRIERYKNNDKAYMEIKLDDGRSITNKQRKMYYATLKDISDHMGHLTVELHDYFKTRYKYIYDDINISMSSCSIGQANQMIDILVEFVLTNDIPLTDLLINRTNNTDRYFYLCILKRKCSCCGLEANIRWQGNKAFSLCEKHNLELGHVGAKAFNKKHHVYGLELDQYTLDKLEI